MRMSQDAALRERCGVRAARRVVRRVLLTAGLSGALAMLGSDAAHAEVMLAQAKTVSDVLDNIRTWLMGILALLAIVFATVGGVRYVMAGGDPGEVEKAKTAFKAAGIGFMLAALAPLFVAVLKGFAGL